MVFSLDRKNPLHRKEYKHTQKPGEPLTCSRLMFLHSSLSLVFGVLVSAAVTQRDTLKC